MIANMHCGSCGWIIFVAQIVPSACYIVAQSTRLIQPSLIPQIFWFPFKSLQFDIRVDQIEIRRDCRYAMRIFTPIKGYKCNVA